MDEDSARLAQLLMEEDEAELKRNGYRYYNINDNGIRNDDEGWQTVSYHKRNKKSAKQENYSANGGAVSDVQTDVFRSIEQHSEDRRRKILESQQQLQGLQSGDGSKQNVDEDDGDSGEDDQGETNGGDVGGDTKKAKKAKKPKKPKVTVAEAAAKIDAGDLGAFLVDVTASFELQQDIQLMRFADYFGRAFASVPSAQFPWLKLFKESAVSKIVDIPIAHVSQDVYRQQLIGLDSDPKRRSGHLCCGHWMPYLPTLQIIRELLLPRDPKNQCSNPPQGLRWLYLWF